jgi:beta-phosphoglucomutase-like phosphatase (HAD superfamily)
MTSDQSPRAALDAIIRQARHVLISFGGPIRRLKVTKATDWATFSDPLAPYSHDLQAACLETGRSVVVISTSPDAKVRVYLDAHDLTSQITSAALSIGQAVTALDASPADCVLITSSPSDIADAKAAGIPTIAYAITQDHADHLAAAGATVVVYSMADLVLKIRATGHAD